MFYQTKTKGMDGTMHCTTECRLRSYSTCILNAKWDTQFTRLDFDSGPGCSVCSLAKRRACQLLRKSHLPHLPSPTYFCLCRFGLFDIENRIFVTFPSDHLTVPLPNNTYQIYYAPNTTNTRMETCFVQIIVFININTGVFITFNTG